MTPEAWTAVTGAVLVAMLGAVTAFLSATVKTATQAQTATVQAALQVVRDEQRTTAGEVRALAGEVRGELRHLFERQATHESRLILVEGRLSDVREAQAKLTPNPKDPTS